MANELAVEDQIQTEVQALSVPCPCEHPRCTGRAFHVLVETHTDRPSWSLNFPALVWRGIYVSATFAGIDPGVMMSGRSHAARDSRYVCWWALHHLGYNRQRIGELFETHPNTISLGIRRGADQLGLVDAAKLATLLR